MNEAPIDLTVERQLAALRDALDTDRPARAEHLIRDIEAMLSLMARETDPLKLALVKAFRPRLNRAIKRFERIRTTDRSRK